MIPQKQVQQRPFPMTRLGRVDAAGVDKFVDETIDKRVVTLATCVRGDISR